MTSDPILSLREALRHSPDNVPLRRHLAEVLLERGEWSAAETEFRVALAQAPQAEELQLGLARTFAGMGKNSAALAILETLVKKSDVAAVTLVWYVRLLLREGQVENAVARYRQALDMDSSVADPALTAELGIDASDRSTVSEGRLRAHEGPELAPTDLTLERSSVKFADVGGMESVKEEIRLKIIYPLQHADMYKAYGKAIGGGILMYGPPGCGKTHLARATAGEINAGFIAIGINDVLDMWIGQSEKNLHELFEQARANKPCVLFFDEVDALGAKRSDMQHSAGRHLINQFLAELDGVSSKNEGLLILAATNAPWHVDSAFRRPGRFDRIVFVPPPDEPARVEILRLLTKGKPQQDLDFASLARKADGFSGADLRAVIDQAVEAKLQEAMRTGRPLPLQTADLQQAASRIKATTKEWFASARNYALYSNQGGTYDEILKYLKLT